MYEYKIDIPNKIHLNGLTKFKPEIMTFNQVSNKRKLIRTSLVIS